MTINQISAIARARWVLMTSVLAITVGATLLVSLLLPKQYTADAEVFVDVKSPDPIAGVVLQGVMLPSYMATQAKVLESERVARRVIRTLQLNTNPFMREQWAEDTGSNGDFEAWLADRLKRNLEVKPGRESNVISVSYTAADPRFAAAIANAYVQAYVDTTIDLRVEPAKQFNALFDSQLKMLREQVEAAQERLSKYQQSTGLLATDERLDIESARLAELSSQLVAIQAVKADTSSRVTTSSVNSTEVLASPVVSALRADMSRQEAKLKELLELFGPAHPQVQQAQASINELRQRIDAETRRVTASLTVSNSANAVRESQIAKSLNEQRARVLKLKQERDQAMVLQRDVENAQRAYDAMHARFYQSSLESQSNAANVSVLKAASAPHKPSSPKLILNTALAFVLGGLFSVGVAMALELSDRKLRVEEDLTDALQLPLLGTMPDMGAMRTPVVNVARPLLAAGKTFRLTAPKKSD